jgi:periplasmic copper chaperone A
MRQRGRAWRVLAGVAVVGAVLGVASPAWAHVEIDPASEAQGSTPVFSFRVPTEETNASTVRLDVQFPVSTPIANVLVQQKPGWTFTTQTQQLAKPVTTDDGTFTTAVTEISWVATAGGIPPGAYDLFPVFGGPLPKTSKLTFKAIQTYSNGDVVRWIEVPTKGAPPPDHPAPTLILTKAGSSGS